MRKFGNIIVLLALMTAASTQIFAQNAKQMMCKDENCVLEILQNFDSKDADVAAVAHQNLDNLVKYVRKTGDYISKNALRDAILAYSGKFSEGKETKYILSLLPTFCDSNDSNNIYKFVENESIAPDVIRVLGDIPGSEGYIEKHIIRNHDNLKYKADLAYAVGKLKITSMENELVSWIKTADTDTKIEIYKALVVIKTNSKTAAVVKKGAKKLCKEKNPDYRIAGLQILTGVEGEKAVPTLKKALKSQDGNVRRAAFELLQPYANEKVIKYAVKTCKDGEAMVDLINWLGDIKDHTQMPLIIQQLSSNNKKAVEAAIRAIFKIDDADGINAVKPMFGGEYQEVIKELMLAYEGDYIQVMKDVVKGNDKQKLAVLQILECRPVINLNKNVVDLIKSKNQDVRGMAYKVMKILAVQGNAEFLKDQLATCDDKYVEDVQLALKKAMERASVENKDIFVASLKYVQPYMMPRFYKVFAYLGTELSVEKLIEAYQNGEYRAEAKEALLLVENKAFADKIKKVLK